MTDAEPRGWLRHEASPVSTSVGPEIERLSSHVSLAAVVNDLTAGIVTGTSTSTMAIRHQTGCFISACPPALERFPNGLMDARSTKGLKQGGGKFGWNASDECDRVIQGSVDRRNSSDAVSSWKKKHLQFNPPTPTPQVPGLRLFASPFENPQPSSTTQREPQPLTHKAYLPDPQ